MGEPEHAGDKGSVGTVVLHMRAAVQTTMHCMQYAQLSLAACIQPQMCAHCMHGTERYLLNSSCTCALQGALHGLEHDQLCLLPRCL